MVFFKFCEISKNIFFTENLWATASEYTRRMLTFTYYFLCYLGKVARVAEIFEIGYFIIFNGKTITVSIDAYCLKSVRIRSYSGPYSVRMWKNPNQNNSEYIFHAVAICRKRLLSITVFKGNAFFILWIMKILFGKVSCNSLL